MATSKVLVTTGTGLLFSNSTEYNAADQGDLERTDTAPTAVQLDMGATAGNDTGECRASTKADLTDDRAAAYAVFVSVEFETAPVAGETVDLYWCPSVQSTAGKGNPSFVSGTDAEYAGGNATLAEGLAQLTFIGSLLMTVDANIQTGMVGVFVPSARYGCMLVHNNTSDDMNGTDGIEMAVLMEPIIDDIAAAV